MREGYRDKARVAAQGEERIGLAGDRADGDAPLQSKPPEALAVALVRPALHP